MRGAYGAAKAGLISLVQTMAIEWAPHRIRVNAIAPGHIVTPRLYDTPQRAEIYANSLLPVQRRGLTDDIGKAALFLVFRPRQLHHRHDSNPGPFAHQRASTGPCDGEGDGSRAVVAPPAVPVNVMATPNAAIQDAGGSHIPRSCIVAICFSITSRL